MQIQKIRIVSNNICYGPMPLPEDEVEQHLTISTSGRVWFTSYLYGNGFNNYKKARRLQINIGKVKANQILSLISKYMESESISMHVTDIGDWIMIITETNEKKHQLKGPLCGGVIVDDIDITELIRNTLLIDDLFVFDGLDMEYQD